MPSEIFYSFLMKKCYPCFYAPGFMLWLLDDADLGWNYQWDDIWQVLICCSLILIYFVWWKCCAVLSNYFLKKQNWSLERGGHVIKEIFPQFKPIPEITCMTRSPLWRDHFLFSIGGHKEHGLLFVKSVQQISHLTAWPEISSSKILIGILWIAPYISVAVIMLELPWDLPLFFLIEIPYYHGN